MEDFTKLWNSKQGDEKNKLLKAVLLDFLPSVDETETGVDQGTYYRIYSKVVQSEVERTDFSQVIEEFKDDLPKEAILDKVNTRSLTKLTWKESVDEGEQKLLDMMDYIFSTCYDYLSGKWDRVTLDYMERVVRSKEIYFNYGVGEKDSFGPVTVYLTIGNWTFVN